MNNFNFKVLGNYSPNIRTFGKYKNTCYKLNGAEYYGDELMNAGIVISDNVFECPQVAGDYISHLIYVTK